MEELIIVEEVQKGALQKKRKKLNLLGRIECIIELSKGSKLQDDFFEKAKIHINYVKHFLHLNDMQTVLFANFIDMAHNSTIYISDIAEFINCRPIKILQYNDDITMLENRKLIRRKRTSHSGDAFRVPQEVFRAVVQNREYQPVSTKNISVEMFFDVVETLLDECREGELTFQALCDEIASLLEDNLQLEIAQAIKKHSLQKHNIVLLLLFCLLFSRDNDDSIRYHDFEYLFKNQSDDMFENQSDLSKIKNELKKQQSELMILGLVENPNSNGFEDRETFKLSDKAKAELLGELNIQEKQAESHKDIVLHTSLAEKTMFYNQSEESQIEQLSTLLKEENFKNVQQRLADKGMRTGFACLFHGSPGTGKTETVYQIARQTGRDIFMVDISQTKSMWFGESEKKIKDVFDRYKYAVKESKLAPILLFNEADAVINKRQEIGSSSVDKTENAIQNILLQEMENIDGIMIATTNLTKNLDKAFERRFLYKIEFNKPNIEAKKSIWQSIIPELSSTDADTLANRYDFSGGQIENIARKATISSIINGHEPDFENLESYCKNEILTKERPFIGFGN